MNHKWDYGSSDARNARSRRCTACWARGIRYGPGSSPWSTTLPDGTYRVSVIPPCPGTPWIRREYRGLEPLWELWRPGTPPDGFPEYSLSDWLIRSAGREGIEAFTAEYKLPPLPEDAWKVLAERSA